MHEGIFISQEKYTNKIFERLRMHSRKPTPTPIVVGFNLSKKDCSGNVNPTLYKILVGSLMHLIETRLDIMHAVSLISRFMETPKDSYWKVRKRILSYGMVPKDMVFCILLKFILGWLVI